MKIPPELADLIQSATRNGLGPGAPRRHHLVPASYLRNWEQAGKLRVTDVNQPSHSFIAAATAVAKENDFYRLEHPDIDPQELPPLLLETMYSRLEGNAAAVTRELIAHGAPHLIDPEMMERFAWHLSMQATRGRRFREEQQALAAVYGRLQYGRLSEADVLAQVQFAGLTPSVAERDEIRAFLSDLRAGVVYLRPPAVQLIGNSVAAAGLVAEHLLFRQWQIYDAPGTLVTCDEPVVLVAGPPQDRFGRSGARTAGVVLYPLSPSRLLAMFRMDRPAPRGPFSLSTSEVVEINHEVLAAAWRWGFERPGRITTTRLMVPPRPPETVIVEEMENVAELADGEEVLRLRRPTRWAQHPSPPGWPVARWWT